MQPRKQEMQVGGSISDQAGLDSLRHAEKNKIHPHSTLGRHVAQEHPQVVGLTLWASLSGPHSLGLTLWASLSGPHSLGLTLWASLSGPHSPGLTPYPTLKLPSHPSRPVAPLPPQSENQFVPCSWCQFALGRRGSGRSGPAQRRGHCGSRRSEPAQRRGSRRSGSAQRGGSRFSDIRPCPMVPLPAPPSL
ncbi:unnamed protein product [Boreogadus saida]